MNRKFCCLLLAFSFALCAHAQDSSEPGSPFRLGSVSLAVGGAPDLVPYLSLGHFRQLAPQSELLQNNLDGFEQFNSYHSPSSFVFSTMIGIDFLNKKSGDYQSGPQLRIGINYLGSVNPTSGLTRTDRVRVDTLESFQSGQQFYTDSIHDQDYNMTYHHDQIQLDLSFVYRTKTKSLLSLYAGLGVSAGMSMMSYTQIDYHSHKYRSYHGESSDGNFESRNHEYEEFENSTNFSFVGYIPLGAELRLGRERALWNQLHLFTELRPGMSYVQLPDLNIDRTRAWYQQTVGIRYRVAN